MSDDKIEQLLQNVWMGILHASGDDQEAKMRVGDIRELYLLAQAARHSGRRALTWDEYQAKYGNAMSDKFVKDGLRQISDSMKPQVLTDAECRELEMQRQLASLRQRLAKVEGERDNALDFQCQLAANLDCETHLSREALLAKSRELRKRADAAESKLVAVGAIAAKWKSGHAEGYTSVGDCADDFANELESLLTPPAEAKLAIVEAERDQLREHVDRVLQLNREVGERADAAEAKLAFLKTKGLTVALAKDADKPERLVYVIESGPELCDLKTMNLLVDAEAKLAAVRERAASLGNTHEPSLFYDCHNDYDAYREAMRGYRRACDNAARIKRKLESILDPPEPPATAGD